MTILDALTCLTWMLVAVIVWRAKSVVKWTTLVTLGPWVVAVVLSWGIVSGLGLFEVTRSWAGRGYLTYLAAVLSLVPSIAVLGARRPTCRAWPMFVLLPMVVVLSWPIVSVWSATGWTRPLQLEAPHVVIYGLVAVMGFGNHVGTRLTLPTLLAGGALILIVSAHSPVGAIPLEQRDVWIAWASLTLALSIALALRWLQRPYAARHRFDRVWEEFLTLYGLVWSRRLLDRLRLLAEKQHWKCEVTGTGFIWPETSDPQTEDAVNHAFRWLLRRFVDPEWLDERLGTRTADQENPVGIDL